MVNAETERKDDEANAERVAELFHSSVQQIQSSVSTTPTTATVVEDDYEPPQPFPRLSAGLVSAKGEERVSLLSSHCRASVIDITAEVVFFQEYRNESSAPLEAKYVLPIDDMAAVCGFEAYVGNRRVEGVVKEKQKARKVRILSMKFLHDYGMIPRWLLLMTCWSRCT